MASERIFIRVARNPNGVYDLEAFGSYADAEEYADEVPLTLAIVEVNVPLPMPRKIASFKAVR